MARPTLNGETGDTKKCAPVRGGELFPTLPAEFGRYRVLRQLGQGGMGAVYLAQDSHLGREVALKLPFLSSSSSQRQERFTREARSAAALHHPNICTVFDAGEVGGQPFITMAYIAGTPLDKHVDSDVLMPQPVAAEIVRKMALALDYAHRKGIVHRDLKPANVMMTPEGEPVVMDFGLAVQVAGTDPNASRLTQQGGVLGTPSYMSPEQVRGDTAAVGPASDVYSLGAVLYELLAGNPPYIGSMGVVMAQILTAPVPSLSEVRPDAHPRLDAICRRALAKAPAQRFESMSELAAEIGRYLAAPTQASQPAPTPPRAATGSTESAAAIVHAPFDGLGAAHDEHAPQEPRPKSVRENRNARWKKPAYVAVGVALALTLGGLVAATVIRVETPNGTLVVEIDDPAVEARIKNGKLVLSGPDGKPLYTLEAGERDKKIDAGAYKVRVEGVDGLTLDTTEFTLKKGGKVTVRVTADARATAKADAQAKRETPKQGFVSFFNGKDLTGWHVEFGRPGQWSVADGVLVGEVTEIDSSSFLLTDRSFTDFAIRLEFMTAAGGNGGIGLRATEGEILTTGANVTFFDHPLIQLPQASAHSVSVEKTRKGRSDPNGKIDTTPGVWRAIEVTVRGDRCVVKLEGREVLNIVGDPDTAVPVTPALMRKDGKIGLKAHAGTMRYRKIEIQDLKKEATGANVP